MPPARATPPIMPLVRTGNLAFPARAPPPLHPFSKTRRLRQFLPVLHAPRAVEAATSGAAGTRGKRRASGTCGFPNWTRGARARGGRRGGLAGAELATFASFALESKKRVESSSKTRLAKLKQPKPPGWHMTGNGLAITKGGVARRAAPPHVRLVIGETKAQALRLFSSNENT